MAQNKVFPAITQNGLLVAAPAVGKGTRKLMAITIAQLGAAGSLLQLYDAPNATDTTKLIYQIDGTVAHPNIEINYPFRQLYVKITIGGSYNIIIN